MELKKNDLRFTILDDIMSDKPYHITLEKDGNKERVEIRNRLLRLYKNEKEFNIIKEIIKEIDRDKHPLYYKALYACEFGKIEILKDCILKLEEIKDYDYSDLYLKARQYNHQDIVDYFELRGAYLDLNLLELKERNR